MDESDIRFILKKRRKELGLTMKDVAKAVGVSEGTVSRWESGNIANMGRDKIFALSKILKLPPTQIMGWDREPDELDKKVLELYPEFVPGKNYISDIIAARQKEEQLRNYLSSVYSDQDMIEDAYEINATMQLYNKDGMKKLRERAEEISELPKYTDNDDETK